MQDVLYIDDVEQAAVLMKPARLELLRRMADETTCTQLAVQLDDTPQRVHYHVKALEKAGLVERVAERRVKGIVEGIYRARARSYWVSPRLIGQIGGERRTQDQLSLGYLISLAEDVQADIAALGDRTDDVPSLGMSAHVELKDAADRTAFMNDVRDAFQSIAEKYGARGRTRSKKSTFRVALACYPAPVGKEKR